MGWPNCSPIIYRGIMRQSSEMRTRRFPISEGQSTSVEGEGHLSQDHSKAIPNAQWYPEMSPYGHMRALVLAASFPDEPKIAKSSPVSDHPFSAGYSDWDQKIIDMAAKMCGFGARKLGDRFSSEPDDIHKASPVNHNSGKAK